MMAYDSSDDYRPLFYVRGHGVYLTTFLVAVHGAAMVLGALLAASGLGSAIFGALAFDSTALLRHGQVWRVVTYALVHEVSLGFILEMVMLYLCGREVERHLGRTAFGWLYLGLLLTTPLVLVAWSLFGGPGRFDGASVGTGILHFGVLIAFTVLYPNVQFFFGIAVKWITLVLLAVYSLADLAQHQWVSLSLLWATVFAAYLGTRIAGGGGGFTFFDKFQNPFPKRRAPAPRNVVKPRVNPRRAVEVNAGVGGRPAGVGAVGGGADVHESINPLLEKISKHGLASLSQSERAALERARVSLLRKDRNG